MILNKETIGAGVGTSISAVGTGLQTKEILQIVSLIITIIGGLLTIFMALRSWWKEAKKDGKIDKDEVEEAANIIIQGGKDIKQALDDKKEETNK